jgi:hypothetical protein
VFSRCRENNVSTELFPSYGCCAVAYLHGRYFAMGLHVTDILREIQDGTYWTQQISSSLPLNTVRLRCSPRDHAKWQQMFHMSRSVFRAILRLMWTVFDVPPYRLFSRRQVTEVAIQRSVLAWPRVQIQAVMQTVATLEVLGFVPQFQQNARIWLLIWQPTYPSTYFPINFFTDLPMIWHQIKT